VADKTIKIKALRKIGVHTNRFAVSCISSATCYGAACLGASPSQIRRRRAISHTTTTIRCAGRSATFDLGLTKGKASVNDPGYRLTCDTIVFLASALWDNWLSGAWILRVWIPAFRDANSSTQLELCYRTNHCCCVLQKNWLGLRRPWIDCV
jgi:hypothetical protein